jgi:hypothetical protein
MYLQLCESDRERYGGPEWVDFDADGLLDTPASKVAEYEKEMGVSLISVLSDRYSATSLRVQAWLARKMAGVTEAYADFDPLILRARLVADPDVDPGKDPSSADSSEPEPSPISSTTSAPL